MNWGEKKLEVLAINIIKLIYITCLIHGENFKLSFNTILNYTLLSCIFDGPLQYNSDITFTIIIFIT